MDKTPSPAPPRVTDDALRDKLSAEVRGRVVLSQLLELPAASRLETVVGAVALRLSEAAEAGARAAQLAHAVEQLQAQAKRDAELKACITTAAKLLGERPDLPHSDVAAILTTLVLGWAQGGMTPADVERTFVAGTPTAPPLTDGRVPPAPPEFPGAAGDPP